jgi:hypothetical protein
MLSMKVYLIFQVAAGMQCPTVFTGLLGASSKRQVLAQLGSEQPHSECFVKFVSSCLFLGFQDHDRNIVAYVCRRA